MNKTQTPLARKDGLVIQEMPDELLVYDLETNKAHCLNETAYSVWKACDGRNTVSDIAAMLEDGSDELVWLALVQLGENDLLDKKEGLSMNGRSRRELIKKVGLASVVALPLVASLTAPTSVLAAVSCACSGIIDCTSTPGCPTGGCVSNMCVT